MIVRGDGFDIAIEDGAVSTGVYVVWRGAVELVHDGEVVDVLDVGQAFGHPSMLTGRAPAFTVRTRVDSDLILVPAQLAVPHLSSEFVAATLRASLAFYNTRAEVDRCVAALQKAIKMLQ